MAVYALTAILWFLNCSNMVPPACCPCWNLYSCLVARLPMDFNFQFVQKGFNETLSKKLNLFFLGVKVILLLFLVLNVLIFINNKVSQTYKVCNF